MENTNTNANKRDVKYKTDVVTLSKVFQALEGMNFEDIPIFDVDDKFQSQFITTLVLSLGTTPSKLNDLFISITGNSREFSEDGLDELCEVAQGFFDNTPLRFKDTLRIMIDAQRQQRNMAIQEMRKSLATMMEEMGEQITSETPISDMKSSFEKMGLIPEP